MIGILGLGNIGKIIAEDLGKTYNGKVVYIVRNKESVKELAKKYNATIRYGDVTKPHTLIKALKGLKVVIHSVHHEYNLNVMKACLKSGVHYLDLGGLYYYTKKQLKLDKNFKKSNLIAILGIGAAPGITNILAKYGSEQFDNIKNIEILLGSEDLSTYKQKPPITISYSIQTILQEFTQKPAVFINGKTKFIEPLTGRKEYKFPDPVGMKKPQYTMHSEIATLPYTLKSKNVSFRIAFDDEFVDTIATLKRLGFLADKEIKIKEDKFNIRRAMIEVLKKLPEPVPEKLHQYEIIRVIIDGTKEGIYKQITLDARIEGLGETIDKDTAVPASIAAQMIDKGEIIAVGVWPPELIIPKEEFSKELAKRKIYLYINDKRIN